MIDDITEHFPFTSCGTQWAGFSDQVMGGLSGGSVVREKIDGRPANILRGSVSLANNGGFIQMATDLIPGGPSSKQTVDASSFAGVELDVKQSGPEEVDSFNVQ